MPSYSMAKSVTSAMIGILVRDGRLDIDEPAAVPEWHEDPDDPRAAITVRHMLHMATGIPWDDGYLNEGSEMYEMVRSDDAAGYAAALHPTADAGERFDYSSGTTTLLARIIGEEVGGDPDDVRAFLHEELFDKIGMTPVEIAFDRAGTWQGSYSADTTAQDYARLGLLYLRGGEWDGEQIVPEQWVEYSRTPSPAEPEYGAHWWLDPRARASPTPSGSGERDHRRPRPRPRHRAAQHGRRLAPPRPHRSHPRRLRRRASVSAVSCPGERPGQALQRASRRQAAWWSGGRTSGDGSTITDGDRWRTTIASTGSSTPCWPRPAPAPPVRSRGSSPRWPRSSRRTCVRRAHPSPRT